MTKPIVLDKFGGVSSGYAGSGDLTRLLAQSIARLQFGATVALIDGSTGTASLTRAVQLVAPFKDAAASGSNLATKATVGAALVTVQNAQATLFNRVNKALAKLGLDTIAYNGGGVIGASGSAGDPDDLSIQAVTKSTTAAATGIPAAALQVTADALNASFYDLSVLTNRLSRAVGVDDLAVFVGAPRSTVPALAALGGADAAPGVTKVAADAALVVWANNVATIAARLNAITSATQPLVLAG